MCFKKLLSAFFLLLLVLPACAQKKYNSLLWEISGKGLKKPSYLYGTMHVSNKLVFRLGDPFYKAISECDVVATELNPDTWFNSFVNSEDYKQSLNVAKSEYASALGTGTDALQNTRAALIKNIFGQDLAAINNLMYRITASRANFEESTFLDLYIYKCAKKLNKKTAGVESYQQLMSALIESSKADMNDREDEVAVNPKDKMSIYNNQEKIEDAYRNADLDALDSLSHLGMSKREADYILYKRNKVMGQFIDSVTKSQRLFIGVGAAHLPGEKGVIEWLRKKGYTVTPVAVGERDAIQRPKLDSLVYKQPAALYVSRDSLFSLTIPGNMLDMLSLSSMTFSIAVDMVNGAYYTVTRTLSSSFLKNETIDHVMSSLDSSFYEIVPGDIVSKKNIERFGYKGFDILNRTRRGDLQRSQIFVTPDEILIFKLNGTDNFAASADAENFFSSISIKPAKAGAWKTFNAPDHTFSINAPPNAFLYYSQSLDNIDDHHLMLASDTSGSRFFVYKHIYSSTNYIERDSFEMINMLESFSKKSDYTLDTLNYSYSIWQGRPVIDASYTTPEKRHIRLRTILNQLDYYLLGVYYDSDTQQIKPFFESFKLQNRTYDSFAWYNDTTLKCKVKLPYVPSESALSYMLSSIYKRGTSSDEKVKTFSRPGYDEEVNVSFANYNRYVTITDSAFYNKAKRTLSLNYNQQLSRVKTIKFKDGWQIDALVSDTNSTQLIHKRLILKNGTRYLIQAYSDSILGESDFVKTFFETFTPQDTVIGISPLINKGTVYLKDLYSSDTALQNKAINYTGKIEFLKADVPGFINAVKNLPKTKEYKDYKDLKVNLLENFSVSSDSRVLDFLKSEYEKYSDTAEYQYAILNALAEMKTPASISIFKDLVTSEQPLGQEYRTRVIFNLLIDSPQLVKDYFTELYALSSIPDYKPHIIRLLAAMSDKQVLKPDQYKDKLPALLSDARNEYKRSEQGEESNNNYDEDDIGQGLLSSYNKLLVPFINNNPGVKNHFDKMLKQGGKELKIGLVSLLLSKGNAVPDSIITTLAADRESRLDLYNTMASDSIQNKFPAKYLSADSLAWSMANRYSYGSYSEKDKSKDSIVFLDKKLIHLQYNDELAFFYKIKTGKSKFWKTKIIGLQPDNAGKPISIYNDLTVSEDYYLDNNRTIRAQFDKNLDEIIKKKIKYQNPYYRHYPDFTLNENFD